MKAWHFLRAGNRTGAGNLLVQVGETMYVPPPVKMCRHGLHFSIKALDALNYASGSIIQLVEVPDDSELGNDKGIAVSRKCLWLYDAANLLHEFSCQCAESALMIANVEDERSWDAIRAKREWLAGRITDAELDAARAAARDAARDAARAAAWSAALAAARDAARDAARAAAWSAARDDMASNLEWMLIQAGAPK
jgi:hypothetical protein